MRIVFVCGSVRENSFTKSILKELERSFQNKGFEIDFIDFAENPLKIYNGLNENNSCIFIDKIKKANALIIACPEYHNSFSGVLKNAFDYLSSNEISNKPIGLIATSGGGKGGINCLNGMRGFLRGMYGLVLPEQVVIDNSETFDSHSFEKSVELIEKVYEFSCLLEEKKQIV